MRLRRLVALTLILLSAVWSRQGVTALPGWGKLHMVPDPRANNPDTQIAYLKWKQEKDEGCAFLEALILFNRWMSLSILAQPLTDPAVHSNRVTAAAHEQVLGLVIRHVK